MVLNNGENMCKKTNYKIPNPRIDKCMKNLIEFIDNHSYIIKVVACCCGHNKYPMTIIMRDVSGDCYDLMSHKKIPRKRRFYKRDKQGYYYIPETIALSDK